MPELPEVETVARQLHLSLAGQQFCGAQVFDSKLTIVLPEQACDLVVQRVFRLGKQVIIELQSREHSYSRRWLMIHLGMTGHLQWHPLFQQVKPEKAVTHLRARFTFDHGTLDFIDPRKFGRAGFYYHLEEITPRGIDPTTNDFTLKALEALLAKSQQAIKVWLLRQDRLVGIGNIYASEILFAARINPWRQAGTLNQDEIRRLYRTTRQVLKKAIRHRGTTFSNFQDTDGKEGGFQKHLHVYDRAGKPCLKCGHSIRRMAQQGRGTFYCPGCQEEKRNRSLLQRRRKRCA